MEGWYNITYQSTVKANSYEIVFGQVPPTYLPYLPEESKIEVVDLLR